MDKIAIILLNYNNHKDTLECVESIKKKCGVEYEIIIVDNNSKEESKEILLENKYKYKYNLIFNCQNSGFASGNNVGIKYALEKKYEYILLLNNDTLICKDSIEIMLNSLKNNKQVGIASCRILYYPDKNKIWYDGGKINWNKYLPIHTNMRKEVRECTYEENEIETEFISGCCMFIKSEVFENVGYLPEEYFMYFEDLDFCIQVIKSNYKLIVCRNSKIYHKVSSSSGGEESPFSIKWGNRNRIILMRKYKNYVNITRYMKINLEFYFTRLLKIAYYLLINNTKKREAIISGIKEGRKYIKSMR